jgi:hypothetical protein
MEDNKILLLDIDASALYITVIESTTVSLNFIYVCYF